MMITKIKVQCLCMPVTLIPKVTMGKIILSDQNETNLLIFGHGDKLGTLGNLGIFWQDNSQRYFAFFMKFSS